MSDHTEVMSDAECLRLAEPQLDRAGILMDALEKIVRQCDCYTGHAAYIVAPIRKLAVETLRAVRA